MPRTSQESSEQQQAHDLVTWSFEVEDAGVVEGIVRAAALRAGLTATWDQDRESEDLYLDTEERHIQRAGMVLRTRRRDDHAETLLEVMGSDAMVRRGHILREQGVAAGGESTLESPGSLADRLVEVTGGQQLQHLFTLHSARRRFVLTVDDQAIATVVLRLSVVCAPDRREVGRLNRLDVLSETTPSRAMLAFVDDLASAPSLVPSSESLLEAGLRLLGEPPETPAAAEPGLIQPRMATWEAARVILGVTAEAFLREEPGVREESNIQAVLDMRDAGRRLRTAIDLFREFLPANAPDPGLELERVGASLSAVRSLGVQLEALSGRSGDGDQSNDGMMDVARLFRRQCSKAHSRLLATLDSERFENLRQELGELSQLAPEPSSTRSQIPIMETASGLLLERFRLYRDLCDELTPGSRTTAYHVLWSHAEQLMHALEFFENMFGRPASKLLTAVLRVEELLGRHQDACVAAGHVRSIAERRNPTPSPTVLFSLGIVAERHQRRIRKVRVRLGPAILRTTGKRWQALAMTL